MTITAPSALELIEIAPTELRTTDQIRADATPDEQLIESVRTSGILQPPTVIWNDSEEAYFIVFGHRRVGAAIIAGLATIPAIVRDASTITEALVLEQQIVENERREDVSQVDLARGWANLEGLFGLTPEDIAAAIAEKPDRIRAGIRAARSEKTHAILATRPTLDLERAAILTEFDEHPAVQRDLAETAETRPENFEWKVRDARTKIAKEARTKELKAELRAAGVKLAKTDTYGGLKSGAAALSDLVNDKGKKLSARNHASCPGHAGRVAGWNLEDMRIQYVCTDYEANGHRRATSAARQLTAEEVQEKAEREARQQAVEANRAARREWIRDLLPGKINQLAGVYDYMAAALLTDDPWRASRITLPLLGTDTPDPHNTGNIYRDTVTSGKVAPFRLMLATALGIHEMQAEYGSTRWVARHMEQLQKWGYTLSDIDEQALAAAREALAEAEARAAAASAEEGGDE